MYNVANSIITDRKMYRYIFESVILFQRIIVRNECFIDTVSTNRGFYMILYSQKVDEQLLQSTRSCKEGTLTLFPLVRSFASCS